MQRQTKNIIGYIGASLVASFIFTIMFGFFSGAYRAANNLIISKKWGAPDEPWYCASPQTFSAYFTVEAFILLACVLTIFYFIAKADRYRTFASVIVSSFILIVLISVNGIK